MPLARLLRLRRKPTNLQRRQLQNIYRHYFGVYKQAKDPEAKRRIARRGYSIQLSLQNMGVRLGKRAPWNSGPQWIYLVQRGIRLEKKNANS